MPKIYIATAPKVKGSGYPPPFDRPCAERIRQRLGNAGRLSDFGVNLMHLPPGNWSSQRHWHSHEDEFVAVLEGELTLVEDGGEIVLRAGDCAAFPKDVRNGHRLVNRAARRCIFLAMDSRIGEGNCHYPDVDLFWDNAAQRYIHKDGSPYA